MSWSRERADLFLCPMPAAGHTWAEVSITKNSHSVCKSSKRILPPSPFILVPNLRLHSPRWNFRRFSFLRVPFACREGLRSLLNGFSLSPCGVTGGGLTGPTWFGAQKEQLPKQVAIVTKSSPLRSSHRHCSFWCCSVRCSRWVRQLGVLLLIISVPTSAWATLSEEHRNPIMVSTCTPTRRACLFQA